MNSLNSLLENLMSKGVFPFEKIISDGDPHVFTDARSGKQFKYTIYEKDFRLIEITCRAA